MREGDERESVSGAMRGGGEGSTGLPLPRTDARDTGVGDGGLSRGDDQAAAGAGGSDADAAGGMNAMDPMDVDDAVIPGADRAEPRGIDDDAAQGRDRLRGGWGDEGIAGGRAGGTGL